MLTKQLGAVGLAFWAGVGAVLADAPPTTQAEKLPFSVSNETTGIVAPLHADGTPDYLGALNEQYGKGVTTENNGFVAWLEIVGSGDGVINQKVREQMLKLAGVKPIPAGGTGWESYLVFLQKEKGRAGETADQARKTLEQAGVGMWEKGERPDVAAYLTAQENPLDAVEEMTKKAHWWIPQVSLHGRSLISVSVPALSSVRDAAATLAARATMRMGAGDFDGFLADEMAVEQLARKVGGGTTLIERLIGTGMDQQASKSIGCVAGSGKLTEAQCKAIKAALGALKPLPDMAEAVDTMERWTDLECVIEVAMHDTESLEATIGSIGPSGKTSSGPLSVFGAIKPVAVDWDAVLRQCNGMSDETVKALRMPSFIEMSYAMRDIDNRVDDRGSHAVHGTSLAPDAGETQAAYSERIGDMLVKIMRPGIWRVEVIHRWAILQEEMLQATLAAAEWHARNGKWPEKLEQLVPDLLHEVPMDIHSTDGRTPVRYKVGERGILLYSLGQNGKDDGGVFDMDKGKDDIAVGVLAE